MVWKIKSPVGLKYLHRNTINNRRAHKLSSWSSLASLLVFDGKTKGVVKSRDSPPTLSSSSSSITHEGQVLGESESTRSGKEEGNAPEIHCSRERSRAAWEIIQDYLTPFVERERYQIPNKCRLHPDNDLYRDQEQHKVHVDIYEWKCAYCRKSFNEEKFLDQHFETRHYNLLNTSGTKCLADLCGALHCDYVLSSKKSKSKCNPAAAAKNRHLCESLANTCFPVSQGPAASRLHEHFLRQFCDAHTCTGKNKPFPRGGKKKSGVFYLAISILTLMLLPLFYLLVFLHQREKRTGTQVLRRIVKTGKKTKPS